MPYVPVAEYNQLLLTQSQHEDLVAKADSQKVLLKKFKDHFYALHQLLYFSDSSGEHYNDEDHLQAVKDLIESVEFNKPRIRTFNTIIQRLDQTDIGPFLPEICKRSQEYQLGADIELHCKDIIQNMIESAKEAESLKSVLKTSRSTISELEDIASKLKSIVEEHEEHICDLQSLCGDLKTEVAETHDLRREAERKMWLERDVVSELEQKLNLAEQENQDLSNRLGSERWASDDLREKNAVLKRSLTSALELLASMSSVYGGE